MATQKTSTTPRTYRSLALDNNDSTHQAGFTISELLVALVVTSVVIVAIFQLFTSYFGATLNNGAQVNLTNESQTILRKIVEEIRTGSAIRQQNLVPDSNAPGGNWQTSESDVVIIIATPTMNADGDFIIDPNTGSPYQTEYVYFVEDTTLFRRTLVPGGASSSSPAEETSCPEAVSSPSCPPDQVITSHYAAMNFDFFDQNNDETPSPSLARSLVINITLQRSGFGEPRTAENQIRMTLRNNEDF
ncbi:TPA: prepilin-type N-terminal cleavage/methylation domain-containing protein [Candidatus Saccharibacteria bacterium]|nr:prepilin-type N-terminal cleavage/methylation domain-containing protein [Candidatus Saccharibacteria bacterium]HIO87974.1 prepilin-type N-terminal cleavage/methylation domain-containing protein [Candidatus Saccharibacteria bacterium]